MISLTTQFCNQHKYNAFISIDHSVHQCLTQICTTNVFHVQAYKIKRWLSLLTSSHSHTPQSPEKLLNVQHLRANMQIQHQYTHSTFGARFPEAAPANRAHHVRLTDPEGCTSCQSWAHTAADPILAPLLKNKYRTVTASIPMQHLNLAEWTIILFTKGWKLLVFIQELGWIRGRVSNA